MLKVKSFKFFLLAIAFLFTTTIFNGSFVAFAASVTISDIGAATTPVPDYRSIFPVVATFDKNTSLQADIVVDIPINDYYFIEIEGLTHGIDYTMSNSGSTVTILKSYLATLPVGQKCLTFDFSTGKHPVLTVNVIDSTIILSGDLDSNGEVDILDYLILQKYLRNTYSMTIPMDIAVTDLNRDGKLNLVDLFTLRKIILNG